MPLVDPLAADHDAEIAELAEFFNVTLGFPPNSVLTMMRRPEIARTFTALNRAVMDNKGKLTPERLAEIWTYNSSAHFTEAEKAAFDFAVAAAQIPNAVDAAIADNLHRHFDDGDIVEILGVIALFGFLNRWNDSMATTLEGPAEETAARNIGRHGWQKGKHG